MLLTNKLEKKLIRLSIVSLEEQVKMFPQIKRVHKSYLINLEQEYSIIGNSRKAFIQINEDIKLPLSREHYSKLKSTDKPI